MIDKYHAIIDFLGSDMTDEQAERLMDEMRRDLSPYQIRELQSVACGQLYTDISMYCGEMGI